VCACLCVVFVCHLCVLRSTRSGSDAFHSVSVSLSLSLSLRVSPVRVALDKVRVGRLAELVVMHEVVLHVPRLCVCVRE
jgi:hypothetical protein